MINKLNLIKFIEGKRLHLKAITKFSNEKYYIRKQNSLFFKKTPTVNKPKRILYSKGSIKIKNYVYQTPPLGLINSIGWIATHFTNHYKRRFYTLIITSYGLFHWRPRIEKKNLSKLIFLCSPKLKPLNKFALFISPAFDINGNQKVCLISYSYKRTIYTKSPGSFAFFRSISWKSWSIIVVLPSQIKKLFTLFVYLAPGRIWGKNLKKFINPKAGFWQKSGFKSIVRGVAKNPVDHHHGGKTTSIAKPVSPWGWIARKK